MNKTNWAKFAVPSLLLGTIAVGCTPNAGLRPGTLASSGPKAARLAEKSAARAQAALAAHKLGRAVTLAETAVAAAPENAAYRVLLGQAYLQSGRFASAETALGEALTLDPGNAKAGLNLALAQVANGRYEAARATLDASRAGIEPADLGLAYALAGAHDQAVDTLGAAARGRGVTAKTRQNLAFALALAGRWAEARAVASQDVNPQDLDGRLRQWAALATPEAGADRIAAVLGVRAVHDAGEPTMLALAQPAPAAAPVATAQADPLPAPAPVEAPAPVAVAEAQPAPPAPPAAVAAAPVALAASQPSAEGPRFFYPGEEATTFAANARPAAIETAAAAPAPAAPRAVAQVAAPKRPYRVAAVAAKQPAAAKPAAWPRAAGGSFVVQLGAFSRPEAAQAAWGRVSGSYFQRAGFTPSSSTFNGRRGVLHRLSIAGFSSREDAMAVCRRIRVKGGACFVRSAAGDQVASWYRKDGPAFAARTAPAKVAAAAPRTPIRVARFGAPAGALKVALR